MATLGMSAADKDAVEAFRRDVVEPSMTELVILDFWAEWCGPCKQLGPVLEKVAKAYDGKGVRLVKLDVDKEKFIAAQFRVQSIPTVYALFQGQPVADLTPARTEGQLTRMIDQLLAQLPIQPGGGGADEEVAQYVAMAEEVLASGDAARALGILEQVAEMAPDDPAVLVLRARALIALDRIDEADALLDTLPAEKAADAGVQQARAAIALARTGAAAGGDLGAARAAAAAGGMEERLALADAAVAAGEREEAADTLLAMIAEDREWNEGAAKARLLTLFAAVGLEDPWVSAQRRRLSAVLFT